MTTSIVFLVLVAYLLGSISSAILLTRLFIRQDIRQQGSGNPGATNVLRVAGRKAATGVFLFDLLKGLLPVYAGYLLGLPALALSVVALSACLGHMFPIFFQFKGGKGVATALGALFPLDWTLTLYLLSAWLLVFLLTRISSLAAIVTFTIAPILTYYLKPDYAVAVALLCLLILLKHKSNILRLFSRQEARFGNKKTSEKSDTPN